MSRLHVKKRLKRFQNYFSVLVSHVTTSETEKNIISAAEGVVKLFQNYISATMNMSENIHELHNKPVQ